MRTLLVVALLALALFPRAARALSTAFTYQGRLTQAGAAPTGSYDFQFALYDAASGGVQQGGTVTLTALRVANGLFTAALDFGETPFAGNDRWLAIAVRPAGGGSYTPLSPRQPLTPTPYALFAKAVDWSGIKNRPADFGVYIAGAGLMLTDNEFSVASDGITSFMLASDAAGLGKVSGGGMTASRAGINVGGGLTGPLFQVSGPGSTPIGVEQLLGNGSYGGYDDPWQSFTLDDATALAAIEIHGRVYVPVNATLTLYQGEGTGGTALATATVPLETSDGHQLLAFDAPVALNAGVYTFAISGPVHWQTFTVHMGNPYAGGRAWSSATTDCYFRLFSAVTGSSRTALAIDRHTLNAGIGTDAPAFPLTFASTLGDKIGLWGGAGAHYGLGIQTSLLQIHTDTGSADIAFGYGSSAAFTERMRIKGTGNVGIGTSAPATKLEVAGTAKMTGFQLGSSATAGHVLTATASGAGSWQAPVAYTAGSGLVLGGTQFSASFSGTGSGTFVARSDHHHDAVYWKQGGNAFAAAGVLGTSDNQQLEVRVNNSRALLIDPTGGSPNLVFGSPVNAITLTSYGSVIGGGGGTGTPNTIDGYYSTVAGGFGNNISGNYGAIAGGFSSLISGAKGAIGGGESNTVSGTYGAIAGGSNNTASGSYAAVGGGYNNEASGQLAIIPGGSQCTASGELTFAAGMRANAAHTGAFVWGDSQNAALGSTGTDQFIVRAGGGVWLGTTSTPSFPAGRFLNTSTGGYLSSTGTWTNSCDRTLKTAFAAIDGGDLLRALAALPITAWRYKANPGERHLGPTAQDFRAAFGLGLDDVSISTVDGIGVALAAAQALADKVARLEAKAAEVDAVKAENAELRGRLATLEALVARLADTR